MMTDKVRLTVVYRLTFDCPGKPVYVGVTFENRIAQRLYKHKHFPNNRRLGSLMQSGVPYSFDIESRHASRDEAVEAEKALYLLMRADPSIDLLNRFTPGDEGGELARLRKQERKSGTGWIVCSVCKLRHPRSFFYKDVHRNSGLGSRCKSCHKYLCGAGHRPKHKNMDASARYYAGKRELNLWRIRGHRGLHPYDEAVLINKQRREAKNG